MNIPFIFKKCSTCGRWLVANTVNFYKGNCKYGLKSQCKNCVEKYKKKYRKENKERVHQYNIDYYQKNKEHKEYRKKYYEEHKQYYKDYKKKYYQTAQGQIVSFNAYNRRKQREEILGNGITPDQWLEMMNFFDWKCAYSGESVSENDGNRTIDHIVPLVKGGKHEIWNCVPMTRKLNSSKNDKNIEEWYPQQDFYSEDRFNKINEWREYAYNKWGK